MKEVKISELPVHIYGEIEGSESSAFGNLKAILKEVPAAHSLGLLFAKRNIMAKYRQSLLGIFWSLMPPLATALIWIVLNKTNVVKIHSPGVPYPLFVIIGTMLWTVFSAALIMPIQTMQANRGILVKINFPRESLIISAFYEVLFNTVLSLLIIVLALFYFKVPLGPHAIFFFSGIVVLLLLGMGIGLLLLPLSMLYKDVQFALPTLLQFLMYLTPVVYALPKGKPVAALVKFNPAAILITNTRGWLLGLQPIFQSHLFISVFIGSVALLIIGFLIQRATMQILIERMGS
jgi:lipopolysaccharide transport system permease protein